MLRRLLPAAVILLVAGCASDAELDTFAPQGPIAEDLHSGAVVPVFAIAGVVFVAITIAMVWLIWRHRVRSYAGDDEWPAQTHGHVPLEVGWTAGFFVTMAAVAVLMVLALPTVDATEVNTMDVAVDGRTVAWNRQWSWWATSGGGSSGTTSASRWTSPRCETTATPRRCRPPTSSHQGRW